MKHPQKKSIVALSVGSALLLSACASTLLWTRIHQDDDRSFASTLAVDAAGASYVGGGVLEAPTADGDVTWWNNPAAVLSKYDSNGQRLWTHTLANTGNIKSIHVLGQDHLLVHVSSPFTTPGQPDAVWIASSETGELISQIDAFSAQRPFADIEVDAEKIYVASAHSLAVFDLEGVLQDSEDVTETIKDIEVSDNGEILLAVEPEEFSRAYQKRAVTLGVLWQTPAVSYPASPLAFSALSGGELAVLSDGSLTKYDAQGNLVFRKYLGDFLDQTDSFYSGLLYYGSALIRADQAGDLYLAATITDFYMLGGDNSGSIAANMATSTSVAKFESTTGELIWKDNLRTYPINGPINSEQNTQVFSNTSYWPVSLDVSDSGIKMVVNAFSGDYLAAAYNNQSAGCFITYEDVFYPAFTCRLVKLTDAYSKEYTYDAASGKRLKKGEKINGNVRDVTYSSTGQLHLVGDNAAEVDVVHYSAINMQWLVGSEWEDDIFSKFLPGGAAYALQSQLFVSKYK